MPGLVLQAGHRFHTSPTANQHDAIAAIAIALTDDEAMFGHSVIDTCPIDPETWELLPVLTTVTETGRPFRSLSF